MLIWGMDPDASIATATYRLFWTNSAGRIDRAAETIEAASDEAAVRKAQALSLGRTAEIWLADRRIASLNGGTRGEN